MPVRPEYLFAATSESPFYGPRRSAGEVLGEKMAARLQTEQLPPGWLRRSWGGWEGWTPLDWQLRLQGWKLHVSATPADAVETLARTTRSCVARQVAFKFRPTEGELMETNGKQSDRGASGKFITIYPDNDDQLAELLDELDAALAGQHGPYILSDLRYGDAPVFVRYGGIMQVTYPDDRDRPVAAVINGDTTRLVADPRLPRFVIPEGVELPDCLRAPYERSRTSTPSRLQEFTSIKSLHYSNAGGVYQATLPDQTLRVLREARPHTGLDGRGRDAIARQDDELAVLESLRGVEGVQQVIGRFQAWEHHFLELEYIPGQSLTSWLVLNTAFDATDGGARRADYARRCHDVAAQFIAAVERVHERGWAIGDLHPGNVLVDSDDHVVLLDFEDACRLDTTDRQIGLRVFEFASPESFTAEQADWYAVARSLMIMYVPEWELEIIAPDYWQEAKRVVARDFGADCLAQIEDVERRYPATARHLLSPALVVGTWPTPPSSEVAIRALDEGVEWSRQYSSSESFPGDATQPGERAETFTGGRAGVVWARARLGTQRRRDVDTLVSAAKGWPEEGDPGLYPGLAGLALALADADEPAAAAAAARGALDAALGRRRLDLYGGQAGVILAAVEAAAAAGDESLLADAAAANDRLQRAVVPDTSAWRALTRQQGLQFGLSGLALTDLVVHRATGEPRPLERAVERIRVELDDCLLTATGELMVRDLENGRALPYLEWGSAGIWAAALVAERLLGEPVLTEAQRAGLKAACSSDVYVYSCLDHGRAGTLAVLAAAGGFEDEVARQAGLLRGRLLHHQGMAFIGGDGLIRLSSDLSTGAIGIALALAGASRGGAFDWLPVGLATARHLESLPRAETLAAAVPARCSA